jgi:hypothetical protein
VCASPRLRMPSHKVQHALSVLGTADRGRRCAAVRAASCRYAARRGCSRDASRRYARLDAMRAVGADSGQLRDASTGSEPPTGRPANGTRRRARAGTSGSHHGNGSASRSSSGRAGRHAAERVARPEPAHRRFRLTLHDEVGVRLEELRQASATARPMKPTRTPRLRMARAQPVSAGNRRATTARWRRRRRPGHRSDATTSCPASRAIAAR